MKFRIFATIACLATLFLLASCRIDSHREGGCEGDPFGDDGPDPAGNKAERALVCTGFCTRLATCGNIGMEQFDTCVDVCGTKYDKNAATTRAGCECVTASTCKPASSYLCPGAPLTAAINAGQTAATPATGSQTADAGSSAPDTTVTPMPRKSGAYVCSVGSDCAWSEDCVFGVCQVRCKASCDCHTAEVCTGGFCALPGSAPVKQSCASDCDCPAGGKCATGTCL